MRGNITRTNIGEKLFMSFEKKIYKVEFEAKTLNGMRKLLNVKPTSDSSKNISTVLIPHLVMFLHRHRKHPIDIERFARPIKNFSASPPQTKTRQRRFANMGFLFKLNDVHKNYACVVIHPQSDGGGVWRTIFKGH